MLATSKSSPSAHSASLRDEKQTRARQKDFEEAQKTADQSRQSRDSQILKAAYRHSLLLGLLSCLTFASVVGDIAGAIEFSEFWRDTWLKRTLVIIGAASISVIPYALYWRSQTALCNGSKGGPAGAKH